jgi:hypothetical protein
VTFARRQLRLRILETLARRAKAFRTRHDIWPLRVPREPILLDDPIDEALGDDRARFGESDLKSRSLLTLEWQEDNSEPSSRWEAWVIALPSGIDLYCDSIGHESRILASARRDAQGGHIDEFFLELLAGSAGDHFGIEMAGGAPSRVRTSVASREFLVDFFVDLFEVTGMEDSVRAQLAPAASPTDDFRADVERWLENCVKSQLPTPNSQGKPFASEG